MEPDDTLVQIEGALDPFRDLRHGELEQLYVDTLDSPAQRIHGRLTRFFRRASASGEAGTAIHSFVCGARGSGKTTQMLRLESKIRDQAHVLFLDLGPLQPAKLSSRSILVILGLALLTRLRDTPGLAEGTREVVKRFRDSPVFTKPTTTHGSQDEGGVDTLIEGTADLMKLAPDPTTQVAAGALSATAKVLSLARRLSGSRARVQPLRNLTDVLASSTKAGDAGEIVKDVNDLLVHFQAAQQVPVLLIIDGVDKARTVHEALAAFDQIELLTDLVAPVVLTGPAQLRHHPSLQDLAQHIYIEPVGTTLVVGQDGSDQPEELARMERMLWARVPTELRPSIDAPAVKQAAKAGAGLPRDSLLILQGAVADAADNGAARVGLEHVERSMRRERLQRQATLNAGDLELLHRVLRTGQLPEAARAHELLFLNYIVLYTNGQGWYRPHALLATWVQDEWKRQDDLQEEDLRQ
jgi:hypothetical protein